MKLIVLVSLLTAACGAQSAQESYLEDFMREYPEARFRNADIDETSCWTVDKEPDTYISLAPSMTREEVYELAGRCLRLGKTKEE